MSVRVGVLLPVEVLSTDWFFYLAAFVAFNTIVFVGLSVGRILYWPRPLSWARVSHLRQGIGRALRRSI